MQPSVVSAFQYIHCHEVIDHPEYVCLIDEYRHGETQFLLAHIGFSEFSPSVFKRLLREWATFRSVVTAPLYAACDDGDFQKWQRFVSHLGFKPTGVVLPCENGELRELFLSVVP